MRYPNYSTLSHVHSCIKCLALWPTHCYHKIILPIHLKMPYCANYKFSHFFWYTAMEGHMTCWALQLTIQQEVSPSLSIKCIVSEQTHIPSCKISGSLTIIHMDLCACTPTLTHSHTHTYRRPKDLLCLALFIVFIVIWIAIGVYGEWTLVQFALRLLLVNSWVACTWRSAQNVSHKH